MKLSILDEVLDDTHGLSIDHIGFFRIIGYLGVGWQQELASVVHDLDVSH